MSSEPFLNDPELRASLLNGGEAQVSEKTAAGSLIGSVRDLLTGKAQNTAEANQRAQMNDMLGEVAADTIAMMPGVSWLKAGGIRAAMMLDLHGSATDNAKSAALNFAEGVALNKVSKLAGNALHEPLAPRSLMSESVSLFKFGVGMGGVKAVFDEHTWRDKDGNFQFGEGISNVAKASTIGGAIGVPAGLAGTHLARLGFTHFAESGLSQRAMSIGLGSLSGYSAGAVFGGVESAMHGGGTSDVLKAAHQGGLMGMFAGGLTGGLVRTDRTAVTAKPVEEAAAGDVARGHVDKVGGYRPMLEYVDNLEIHQPRDFAENLRRLGDYKKGRIVVETAKPDADQLTVSAAERHIFEALAKETAVQDSRIYTVKGTEIHIPESYAVKLDEVYNLRMTQQRGFAVDATPAEKAQAVAAQEALANDGYAQRAHPADLAAMLEQLPDRSLISKVQMLDTNYWADAWTRKTYQPDFVTAATANRESGIMTFYKSNDNIDLPRVVHHEWAHLLETVAQRERAVFESAVELEQKSWNISEYAKRDSGENWAEHSAALTKASTDDFFDTASGAPVRTAVLGRALSKSLNFVPEWQRSPYIEQLSTRVRYIQDAVLPRAQDVLAGYLKRGTPEEQVHAAKLLRELGDKQHFEILKDVAKSSKHPEVHEAAFDAAQQMAFYGREIWSGYDKSQPGHNRRKYTDFLVSMAQPGSKVRDRALEYLHPLEDGRSEGYYSLLTWERNPHPQEQMKALLNAMRNIHDEEPRLQAWDIGKRLAGTDAQRQYNYAIAVYQLAPGMQNVALRHMIALDPVKTEPALLDIMKKPTHPLKKIAQEGLAEIDAVKTLNQLERQLESHSALAREEAIVRLGESGDLRGISPLLRKYAFGTKSEHVLAAEVLDKHFTWQLVKAEAHRLMREDPRWGNYLRPLLERRPATAS